MRCGMRLIEESVNVVGEAESSPAAAVAAAIPAAAAAAAA